MKIYSLRKTPIVVAAILLAVVVAQAQMKITGTNVTTLTTTNGNTITTTTTTVTTIIKTNAAAAATNVALAHPIVTTNANAWKSSISFGLTLARGNTDTTLASATATTEKKWLQNDLVFGADGLYGENKATGQSPERKKPPKPYMVSLSITAVSGAQPGTAFMAMVESMGSMTASRTSNTAWFSSPGLGYYFVTNKTADFSAEVGPGYVKEQLGDDSESFATLRLTETLHYNISPHAKAWENVKFLPQVNRFDNYLVIAEVGVEAGLTKGNKLSVRSVLQDNYNNIPAANRLKNDLKLITSLVYKF